MTTFKDLDAFFKRLDSDFARKAVPRIIAEKATEFYKQRFTTKEWEGIPWPQTKNPVKVGSLMVRSGKTMASVKPSVVTPEVVKISAGGTKAPQAKIHNEGGIIDVPVTPQMRKFAWAMNYKTKDDKWKGLALTKKQTLRINMPKRQYMGHSPKLNAIFMDSFKKAFKNLF